jgi:hypothetical protein
MRGVKKSTGDLFDAPMVSCAPADWMKSAGVQRYLRRRRRELVALSSLASASVLRMLRASRKISMQDNSST